MLAIPLDDEIKTKGKAAVDVIGTKIGKALGSLSQFLVFIYMPTLKINDIVLILLFFYIFAGSMWVLTTKSFVDNP